MAEPATLEIFTDYVCPWCYLCTARVQRLLDAFHIRAQWVFFPLHPDTPRESLSLESIFRGRPIDLPAVQQRLADLMAAEGLPYGVRTHTYNTRLAQELGKWAESSGVDAMHDALYRAYFVEGTNIAEIDELIRLAAAAGLPADEAAAILTERRYKAAVDADWAKARHYGITGVPTFVAGTRGLVGAQPYAALEQFVSSAGAVRRSAGTRSPRSLET